MSRTTQIRDRIKELRRVRAGDLRANPRNWRRHPESQRQAMQAALAEIGFADACLARELSIDEGGSGGKPPLEIIDGHLRASIDPETIIPVLVLDVTRAEADKLLLMIDPLAAMAETSIDELDQLLAESRIDSEALQMIYPEGDADDGTPTSKPIPEVWSVVVDCEGEAQQREVYERLTADGLKCRLLSM